MQLVPITVDVVSLNPLREMCTTLCDKVCQFNSSARWFTPGTLVSSIIKSYLLDIAEILLIVALNTIKQTNRHIVLEKLFSFIL